MSFEIEHQKWLDEHKSKRKGRRLDALKRGHGFGNQLFAKKIWWNLFGHFNGLHPEYEILDWRGQPFYADFMWKIGTNQIVFEVQDFGTHILNMDRSGYCRELNRGLFIQSLHIAIIYVPLDELKENSELILSMIRNIIAPYFRIIEDQASQYSKLEKELMRYSVLNHRILRPFEAAIQLEVHPKTIIKHASSLVKRGKLRPIPSGRSRRIHRYEYIGSLTSPDLY